MIRKGIRAGVGKQVPTTKQQQHRTDDQSNHTEAFMPFALQHLFPAHGVVHVHYVGSSAFVIQILIRIAAHSGILASFLRLKR